MNATAQKPEFSTGVFQPYGVSIPDLCAAYPSTQVDSPLVFVADDDTSGGEVLEAAIRAMEFVPIRVKTADMLFQIAARNSLSCLIIDITFLRREGFSIPELIDRCAVMPVIFTAQSCDISTTVTAMKAGAFEFLLKPLQAGALDASIRSAIQYGKDQRAYSTDLQDLVQRYGILTQREKEVMSGVVTGLLNKQVAAQLEISEITVKVHRGRVMRKMRARSLAELVRMSIRLSDHAHSSSRSRMSSDTDSTAFPNEYHDGRFQAITSVRPFPSEGTDVLPVQGDESARRTGAFHSPFDAGPAAGRCIDAHVC